MTRGRGDGAEERTDPRNDRELIAAHLSGDNGAFGTLFHRHRDRLWAVALRTCGDREEAADALQDGLVSAFRRAESYRGEAAVGTWLHRIVVNACLDRMRRAKVRLAVPLPDDVDAYADRGAVASGEQRPADDPAEALLGAEHRAAVIAALDTLAPEQKAALVLVDMEGYSIQEAASMLGCAAGTVKSRCARGRNRLLPLLQGLVAEPTPVEATAGGNPTTTSRVQDARRGEPDAASRPAEGGGPK